MHFRILNILTLAALAAAVPSHADDNHLDTLVVTSAPLGGALDEQAQPVTILEGDSLKLNLASSLGETLSRQPGISSTSHGPGASRPIIRGLGGERIKILQNGTATLDASSESVDHAVSIQPLNVSRIEVVRGPATLLYGTSAVGGIVNVIDNRIPNERIEVPLTGTSDLRYRSESGERAGALLLEGGAGSFAFHLDGFKRNAHNITIPGDQRSDDLKKAEPLEPGEREVNGTLPNSAVNEQGGSIGGSFVTEKGYIGGSFSGMDSNYGTVGEPEVTIGLRQQRFDFAGAINQPFAYIDQVKLKVGISDYQHIEYEGATPGTKFENEGYDARIDVIQEKIGPLEGAFGFQSQKSSFSALGEEAFLPPSETEIQSAFVFQKVKFDPVSVELGGRFDHTNVRSDNHDAFGPGRERDFSTFGASAGLVYKLGEEYTAALSTAYTQRAPSQQELFANGPHVATLAFEIGDPDLDPEKSTGIDFSIRKNKGRVTGALTLFANHFDDFISLQAGGFTDEEEPLRIYNYRATEARFIGGEFEATLHLHDTPDDATAQTTDSPTGKGAKNPVAPEAPPEPFIFDLNFRSDYVRAQDLTRDEPLPRIPPWRLGGGVLVAYRGWSARADVDHNFAQNRNSPDEFPTDSYTLVSARIGYRFNTGPISSEIFVRGTNLLDEEARNSTSFLKEVAPLPGRGVELGLQMSF
ncbi:MAG TPA: TonB-dependent receptor [Chthoniobacterales bacterium]|jgi:iron complex outermembrane receptor protein